ncbi:MAG TPA: aspartate-semialdehyde dehydrogenase [Anaerolineae bacterium]|nr:aspartate-semialdehyde dehydrogenase [Anaerolineae bacterium]
MGKIKVAVLGATGAVGQRFVQLLENHPWFEVTALTGSDRSVGQTYGDACRWVLDAPMPEYARSLRVVPTEPGFEAAIAFSALPADQAKTIEPAFARAGHGVCSNASSYRMDQDVPLLIPEVNPDHTALIKVQQQQRGWSGFIATNPNCTSTGFTIAFRPLLDAFGIQKAFVVSMQALSGAGYPGVASLDAVDNVIPYISGEEPKVETEPLKMLGRLDQSGVIDAPIKISAHTNRVAVIDGHTVCVSIEFDQPIGPQEAAQALADFKAPPIVQSLPSAPHCVIEVRSEADRPQPRRDRNTGNGMTTVVGRVREDPLFHVKFVVLSHNTIRGAAGGSLLNAELLVAQGLVK